MAQPELNAEKITSPMQLMAAWFVMLILLSGVLLTAASQIENPDWAAGYLVAFCSLVIIAVIACVTLMLTKFRPHLQDGKEYAEWLKERGAYSKGIRPQDAQPAKTIDNPSKTPEEAPKISDPSEVRISVLNAVGGINIMERLKNIGFNADLHESIGPSKESSLDNIENNQGIWVGRRVPSEVVMRVIKEAIRIWPELKFIYISGDRNSPPDYIHDQIFIGGANSAVKYYKIRPWSTSEFKALEGELNLEKFHALVRAKYL
jgi:hypothetical protein